MSDRARQKNEAVILVHGLWLGGWSLAVLARRLAGCGFTTYPYSFPTCRLDLYQNALRLHAFSARVPESVVHFVGHSLGGVVIRALFHYASFPRPGRVVTLGSPHAGSAAAVQFGRTAFGRRCLGRSIAAILTGEAQGYRPIPREVGVIAGCVPLGLGRLFVHRREVNDGVVSASEASLPEAVDTITLATSHTGMLVSRDVAGQACAFLRHGRFRR